MNWLVGEAGYAFFDYWTLAHLGFWFFVGSSFAATKLNRCLTGVGCVCSALLWEVFERFAEKEWPSMWQSPESWWNSWLSDPLTTCVGLGIAFFGFDHWREPKK